MNTHDPSRRKVLRGAVAGCFAVSVPNLFACDRQENVSSAPATATQANEPHPTDPQPNDPQPEKQRQSPEIEGGNKLSQEQAQYQPQPKADQQCSNCQHFAGADNTCKVVAGTVAPEGWCILWAATA